MKVGDRIKHLRNSRRMTLAELSGKVGVSRQTLSRYETGVITNISLDMIEKLADALETTPAYIMGWEDDPHDYDNDAELIANLRPGLLEFFDGDVKRAYMAQQQIDKDRALDFSSIPNLMPMPKMKKVPLIGTIQCGEPVLADENIEDYYDIPSNISADFALKCKGDSMVGARIFDGDIAYIRQQPDVENGEIAAVLIDDEATLKRVYKIGDNLIELRAENPRFKSLYFEGEKLQDVHIVGKAIYFLSKVH